MSPTSLYFLLVFTDQRNFDKNTLYCREQLCRYGAGDLIGEGIASGCESPWGSDFSEQTKEPSSCAEGIYETVAPEESSVENETFSMERSEEVKRVEGGKEENRSEGGKTTVL